ncbi:hypothetical protein ACLMJK_001195 [Lecanora helva]
MPFLVKTFVAGGCRLNSDQEPIGAAVCIKAGPNNVKLVNYEGALPANHRPQPTADRADLAAVILGLQAGWNRYVSSKWNPQMDVKIHTASQYAVNVMTVYKREYARNYFMDPETSAVVENRDLMRRAYELLDDLEEVGRVEFVLLRRGEGRINRLAEGGVKVVLDELEEE